MRDEECVAFLRWCLPRLGLRWPGFRKVRGTVCKRIERRRRELGLSDAESYRAYLESHPDEWCQLDALCRIPISRFWRDPEVFGCLAGSVLLDLARRARHDQRAVRCWSAGCGSGEEPYSLRIAWAQRASIVFPDVGIEIIATDADATMLTRAEAGIYRSSSLRDLPVPLRTHAFERSDDTYRIRDELREGIRFAREDLRDGAPPGGFDLILCRNLAFTYFEPAVQRKVLARLKGRLCRSGYLVIGANERLPDDHGDLAPAFDDLPISRLIARASPIRSAGC